MVPPENLLAFTLAALVLIVIPGPSVLFTIGRALALGRIGGAPARSGLELAWQRERDPAARTEIALALEGAP